MTRLTAANQKPLALIYDTQILRLLVFTLKTCSDQILAKLLNQGVAAALFSSRHPKNLQNEKFSSSWILLKLTWGGAFFFGQEERF